MAPSKKEQQLEARFLTLEEQAKQLEAATNDAKARQDKLEKNLESDVFELKRLFKEQLAAESQRLEERLNAALKRAEQASKEFAQALQEGQRTIQKNLDTRLEAVTERLSTIEPQLLTLTSEIQETGNQREKLRMADEAAAANRREMEERITMAEGTNKELSVAIQAANAELQDARKAAEARAEELHSSLRRLGEEVATANSSSADAFQAFAAADESNRKMLRDAQGEFNAGLESLRAEKERELSAVDEDVERRLAALRDKFAESIYNRQVSWCIRGFQRALLKVLRQDPEGLASGTFSLCALPEMVLELEMPCKTDRGETPTSSPLPGQVLAPGLPVPGSFSLRLWAVPGLHLSFRLQFGDAPSAFCRTFEHTFLPEDEGDAAQRVSFLMQNVSQLNQAWVRDTDTFCVSLEVLEFQWDPSASSIVPAPRGAPPKLLQETEKASTDTASPRQAPVLSQEENTAPTTSDLEENPSDVHADHRLVFNRRWRSENLVQDKVTSELEAVRNRSVRRVEWRLECCSRMLEHCRAGDVLDSPIFQAVGLDRLQLHFYPLGTDRSEPTGKVQPCALFVSGPEFTRLRGTLTVGSHSRPFEHGFSLRGDTGGRDRVCNLENQLDCDDAVVIALEVTDVEVDLPRLGGSLCLRATRAGLRGGSGGRRNSGCGSEVVSPLSPLKSSKGSLIMRREDPSKTEEFVKCASLPTLTAQKVHLPLVKASRRV